MSRPPASFLSRSGILSYLRRLKGSADPAGDELSAAIARTVGSAVKPWRDELVEAQRAIKELGNDVRDMRGRQRDLRNEVRLLHAVLVANSGQLFERYAGARDLQTISRHAASSIAAAPMDVSPTPHMIVRDLLPRATYEALRAAIPPDECFADRDPIKQNFRPSQAKVVPDFTATMWALMEQEVIAGVLVPGLMARFRPYIETLYAGRYGERGASIAALRHEATAGRLMLRRPGYHLDPHVDPRRVIVTCLIYLANDGDNTSFGTQFFALNAVPSIEGTKTYYPGEHGFTSTLVKTVDFTPNTAVAFLNAGAAAHGATIPADAPADTKRYAYQFYVSPDPEGLAAITGESTDEARD